jgi:uncharacterized protein YutE (UPF0331/DUF86 family)
VNASGALNQQVVQERLREMRVLLDYLRTRTTISGEALRSHTELRLAVERALTQLVELATSVNLHVTAASGRIPPSDYYSSFLEAAEVGLIEEDLAQRLAPSAGLRNVLVHEYLRIDVDRVAATVPRAVVDFDAYVRQAATHLAERRA